MSRRELLIGCGSERTKRCSKCLKNFPANTKYFNKANWLKSGLRSDCKECYSAFKKESWGLRPETAQTKRYRRQVEARARGVRICRACGIEKSYSKDCFATMSTGQLDTKCRECAARATAEWARNNYDRALACAAEQCARRYARKRHRTPEWLTKEHFDEMREIYEYSSEITKFTGIPHNVDHIVPLVGKTVSGLHVPWNLWVISAKDNQKKHNRWLNA